MMAVSTYSDLSPAHFSRGGHFPLWFGQAAGDETPDHHPLPSLLASAAHSGPLREIAGRHHDHGPGRLNLVAKNTAPMELVHKRAVGDAESVHMGDGPADSMGRGRRRGRAYPDQYERRDDFAPSRSGNGLAAMPSHRLTGPRGPLP